MPLVLLGYWHVACMDKTMALLQSLWLACGGGSSSSSTNLQWNQAVTTFEQDANRVDSRPESRRIERRRWKSRPADLQQVVRRKGIPASHGWGIMSFSAQESLKLATPAAPSNTGRSRPRSDGSILTLAHPRLLAQLFGWLVDMAKRSSFQRKRFGWFSRAIGGLNAMAGHSDFSNSLKSLQQDVAARCWSPVDSRLHEMSDAPQETGEVSLRWV